MINDQLSVSPRLGSFRRGTVRTLIIALIGAVVLVVAGIGAASLRPGQSDADRALDLHSVSETSFDIDIIATGELEALTQTDIRNELENPASITHLVDEGARVQAGEVLVELNAESIKTSIEDELLKVETARSDLIAAENGYEIQVNENDAAIRRSQLKLDLAEIELRKWEEGDLVKKLEDLTLAIDQAERRLEQRKEAYEQSQRLFDRGFLASDQLKNDEISYIDSQAALKTARSNKWVYETFEMDKRRKQLTSDVEEAAAELERTKRQNASRLVSKDADRTNKRRQLQIREERLAKLREQLEKSVIKAPTAGLVVYGSTAQQARRGWGNDGPMQIGQSVSPNELLIVLPDTEQMVATVRVHEANAGRVRPGQRAIIRVDAIRDRVFDAKVLEIGVLAESGGWRDPNRREYTVKLLLDAPNSAQVLKPSMRCEAEIVIERVNNVLAVPSQAVFRDGPVNYVYMPDGSRYQRTPVKIGRRSTQFAEIRSGVEPGEYVLLREPTAGEISGGDAPDEAVVAGDGGEEGVAARQNRRAQAD